MLDYTPEEIKYYLDLAAKLKADKAQPRHRNSNDARQIRWG